MKVKSLHFLFLIPCVTVVLLMPACTRNDGDIGDLFGRWKVVSISADGEQLALYDDDVLMYSWSFQGSLLWVQTLYPHQDYTTVKGMWSRTDRTLSLDFSYTGDDGDDYYRPPQPLHLVSDGVTVMSIADMSSSEMSLWYVSEEDGVKYEYYLKKVY